jgi:hypothetical protein
MKTNQPILTLMEMVSYRKMEINWPILALLKMVLDESKTNPFDKRIHWF